MIVKICSSCTARQQELNRLKKQVRALETKLKQLAPPPGPNDPPSPFCAACGHRHPNTMTRHHRIPQRISWKIPHAARKEVLGRGDVPEVINLCQQCHRFVETASFTGRMTKANLTPCPSPIGEGATVTWAQLMGEIRAFERIAENYTEDLLTAMREGIEPTPSDFSGQLSKALDLPDQP